MNQVIAGEVRGSNSVTLTYFWGYKYNSGGCGAPVREQKDST